MNLLAIKSAKSVWLLTTVYLNPRGQDLVPVIAGLVDRYRFVKAPQPSNFATQPLDLRFEGGSFKDFDGASIFVNVSIHDDGLVAESRASTDATDRFLHDALSWFSEAYGMPQYPELVLQKLYVSELVARMKLPTTLFSEKFQTFMQRMQQGVTNNPGVPMHFSALHFGPNPETTKKVAAFRVERVAGSSFEREEFYSAAPLPTNEHLELLREMEDAASA